MRFAIVGGDRRSALLAGMLLRDGHRVHSYALEEAALPPEIPREACLQSCVYGADCVVLPVPAEGSGFLTAPLSPEKPTMDAVIGGLWPGQLLIGGRFSDRTVRAAIREKLRVEDLMQRPEFVMGNAALTAEGALGLLLQESDRAVFGSSCLITGWGRIGRLLAPRLSGLGARVTVAARGRADRSLAEALGYRALSYAALEGEIGDFDFLVNTVPARVLADAMLCCVSPEALLLELASPPGGFDRNLAENIGLHALYAPGLPGKCAPRSAARLMQQAVYAAIREQEE